MEICPNFSPQNRINSCTLNHLTRRKSGSYRKSKEASRRTSVRINIYIFIFQASELFSHETTSQHRPSCLILIWLQYRDDWRRRHRYGSEATCCKSYILNLLTTFLHLHLIFLLYTLCVAPHTFLIIYSCYSTIFVNKDIHCYMHSS